MDASTARVAPAADPLEIGIRVPPGRRGQQTLEPWEAAGKPLEPWEAAAKRRATPGWPAFGWAWSSSNASPRFPAAPAATPASWLRPLPRRPAPAIGWPDGAPGTATPPRPRSPGSAGRAGWRCPAARWPRRGGSGPAPGCGTPTWCTPRRCWSRRVRRGQRLVVTIHDAVPWTHPATLTPRGVRWHRQMAERAVAAADAVVVPTEAVAAELVRHLRPRPGQLQVIGEGVADTVRSLPPDAAARARRLALPDGGYLLTLATLEPRKGLDVALAALARPEAPGAAAARRRPPRVGRRGPGGPGRAAGPARRQGAPARPPRRRRPGGRPGGGDRLADAQPQRGVRAAGRRGPGPRRACGRDRRCRPSSKSVAGPGRRRCSSCRWTTRRRSPAPRPQLVAEAADPARRARREQACRAAVQHRTWGSVAASCWRLYRSLAGSGAVARVR